MPDWFFRRGELARDGWETVVDDTVPGWQYTGLRVAGAGSFELPVGDLERMIVPLDARVVTIDLPTERIELAGRASVFEGPADVAYLGVGTGATVTADGRFAVAEARASVGAALPSAVLRAADIPVELRGAGAATRQVHNFGTPEAPGSPGGLHARRMIVCEVVTPAGNWSSHPAHKHDESVPGHESQLEEIYWFEAAVERGRRPEPGALPFGMFSAHGSPGHPIDLDETVHTGDVALIPHGYHGPASAAPGYDLYYLNVMAGPGPDREWLITDDPGQAWIRSTWKGMQPDARLPYSKESRRR